MVVRLVRSRAAIRGQSHRLKALELTREWVDVRDSQVLASQNQTP